MNGGAAHDDRRAVARRSWPRVESGSADLSEEELRRWGEVLGAVAAEEGVFVALYGPLGGGKTTLVQAAVRGAGGDEPARSPSYVLHRRHALPAGGVLHHVDLYRLTGPGDLDALGWDELLASGDAIFVEWSDRADRRLPRDRWDVRLGFEEAPARRHVEVERRGEAPAVPSPGGPPSEDPAATNTRAQGRGAIGPC